MRRNSKKHTHNTPLTYLLKDIDTLQTFIPEKLIKTLVESSESLTNQSSEDDTDMCIYYLQNEDQSDENFISQISTRIEEALEPQIKSLKPHIAHNTDIARCKRKYSTKVNEKRKAKRRVRRQKRREDERKKKDEEKKIRLREEKKTEDDKNRRLQEEETKAREGIMQQRKFTYTCVLYHKTRGGL